MELSDLLDLERVEQEASSEVTLSVTKRNRRFLRRIKLNTSYVWREWYTQRRFAKKAVDSQLVNFAAEMLVLRMIL